ncbi:MAG TPA: VOC family protein [Vicinamibacterales bacterium]|jgi:catechol 2,3-dioxygenase-like lactoylglutathione lyase family enzyme|nr:VOC family protein [Vicinamibacterales bacterium]
MVVEFQGLTPLIQVFDMPASIRFYRDVLGFVVVTASGPVPDCGWALLRRNTDEIMLNTQYEDEDRPAVPDESRRKTHNDTCFYFGCYDLDAAYAHLQANGVAAQKPSVAPYGMRQLYFTDPDGFNLCFQHPVSEGTVEST